MKVCNYVDLYKLQKLVNLKFFIVLKVNFKFLKIWKSVFDQEAFLTFGLKLLKFNFLPFFKSFLGLNFWNIRKNLLRFQNYGV